MLPWRQQSFSNTKYMNGRGWATIWGGLASCRLRSGGRAIGRGQGLRCLIPLEKQAWLQESSWAGRQDSKRGWGPGRPHQPPGGLGVGGGRQEGVRLWHINNSDKPHFSVGVCNLAPGLVIPAP